MNIYKLVFPSLCGSSICLFVPVWLAAGLRQWVLNNMEGCAVSRRMLCSQQKLGSGWSCCRYTHTRSLAHALTWAVCQMPLKPCIARPRVSRHTDITHAHTHTHAARRCCHRHAMLTDATVLRSVRSWLRLQWCGVRWCRSDVLQQFCVLLSYIFQIPQFTVIKKIKNKKIPWKQRFLLSILEPEMLLCKHFISHELEIRGTGR